jgi:DNA-binding protein H-NS
MSDLHRNFQAYQELQAQIRALQEKATLLMMEGRNAAIGDIKALISAYDLTAEELGYTAPPAPPKRERKPEKRRDRSVKGAPKYRDPVSGATWTGSGRVPNWLIGQPMEDFLIEKPALVVERDPVPVSPAQEASQAVANMVSGSMPQPAAAWPDPRQTS